MVNYKVFQDDDEVIENHVTNKDTKGLDSVSQSNSGFEKNGVLLKAMEKMRKETGVPLDESKNSRDFGRGLRREQSRAESN